MGHVVLVVSVHNGLEESHNGGSERRGGGWTSSGRNFKMAVV